MMLCEAIGSDRTSGLNAPPRRKCASVYLGPRVEGTATQTAKASRGALSWTPAMHVRGTRGGLSELIAKHPSARWCMLAKPAPRRLS